MKAKKILLDRFRKGIFIEKTFVVDWDLWLEKIFRKIFRRKSS